MKDLQEDCRPLYNRAQACNTPLPRAWDGKCAQPWDVLPSGRQPCSAPFHRCGRPLGHQEQQSPLCWAPLQENTNVLVLIEKQGAKRVPFLCYGPCSWAWIGNRGEAGCRRETRDITGTPRHPLSWGGCMWSGGQWQACCHCHMSMPMSFPLSPVTGRGMVACSHSRAPCPLSPPKIKNK